jgi:indolepyruvate ferredoxin oxidoreductase
VKHAQASLADKYRIESERFYVTGTQALVRLPMLQRALDRAAGLNTGGFVSGYRGSPLGQVDIQMWAAKGPLDDSNIRFQPGVNEELAATSVWGTQQVTLFPGATVDGVFAYWYGKGPGVDRCGDVFKHANYAGTSRHGGVLLMAGDDHSCKSSTIPHQSEQAFIAAGCPVLVPADVQELLSLGLHGWAMSRWSGRYVGFKTVADVVDSSASVAFGLEDFRIRLPEGPYPDAGIRLHDIPLEQEARALTIGLPAAQAYARANGLDRVVRSDPGARLGIVTIGKSYHDTRQALAELGDPGGIRLLKLAMAWPLDPATIRDFAQGLEEILVVEEKAPLIEAQIRDILYALVDRPRIVGKTDETGAVLLKRGGDLSSADIAHAAGTRIARFAPTEAIAAQLAYLDAQARANATVEVLATRRPFYCSGCPHNTSTRVPDGSRALAGIGCHTLAMWMDRNTDMVSQMGGEGMAWVGQAPFTEEKHVFANLGDGTYFHSGMMAIRASVSAGVNITYKLLFNDAVAMTGGQHVDGPLTVPQITRQLAAEDVVAIAIVTDEPEKHAGVKDFAPGVTVHHRRELEAVEKRFRETPGCTVLIYDQTCASEKRRRRKRGQFPDPDKRAFINTEVCEGCGDCSQVSNCISVTPAETALGTKRRIDQSSCNKDFSCVDGFCPSFVTVHGAKLHKRSAVAPVGVSLPEPVLPSLAKPYDILVTGIGGTGIVTVGALLGMAAHLDGVGVTVLDMMGLAQKGGSVWSHVRLAADTTALQGLRVGRGRADLLLAADIVTAAAKDTLASLRADGSRVVLNTNEAPTADFVMDTNTKLPAARLRAAVERASGTLDALDATALAASLLGDAIGANLLLLGYAWQKGAVPLSLDALMRAIELNGQAVEANKAAFLWGRIAAADPARVASEAGLKPPTPPMSLDEVIGDRAARLKAYGGTSRGGSLAKRYRTLVARTREAEARVAPGSSALTDAVARNFYKLLAIKDEWEVARLYAAPGFRASLAAQFGGWKQLEFHLAPPLLAPRDKTTGHLVKRSYGPWMMRGFRVLSVLRILRATPLDPFARAEERRAERALIPQYEADIATILAGLRAANLDQAVEIAAIPDAIRGYGHVKEKAMRLAAERRTRLLEAWATPPLAMAAE